MKRLINLKRSEYRLMWGTYAAVTLAFLVL